HGRLRGRLLPVRLHFVETFFPFPAAEGLMLEPVLRAVRFARSLSVTYLRPRGVQSMDTSIRWNTSVSRIAPAVNRPKWEQVCQGLGLAALAHACVFALVGPGMFLVWLGHHAGSPAAFLGLGPDGTGVLGWVLAGAGAFLGYSLLLAAQWRCLTNAPQ